VTVPQAYQRSAGISIVTRPSTSQTREGLKEGERDTIHTILQPSATFHITPIMLCMDEIMGQKPLKDLAQLQLVFLRIPSKSLLKLYVSVTQEVQSHARTYLVELQHAMEKWDALELIYEQFNLETQEEREHMNGLGQNVVETYEKIPKIA
jgi:hypothetical protein